MKRIFLILFLLMNYSIFAQINLGGLLGKSSTGDSSSKATPAANILNTVLGQNKTNLSTTDIAAGLKEALQVGTQRSTTQLSAVDGFFKNAAIKILLPPEAQKIEKTLRSMGLNKQVDDAILSMNRAAEDAAKTATPIFVNAIKQITFTDAVSILKGNDSAATKYLRQKTSVQLTDAFKPIIQNSLQKVDATKYWQTLTETYNKIPFVKKVNTDLTVYVTGKALSGIFYQVGLEEQKIRKDPVAQTTDLLKKVFGK
jgi:hypothetical protein